MTASKGYEPTLPDEFAPPSQAVGLYEGVRFEEHRLRPAEARLPRTKDERHTRGAS